MIVYYIIYIILTLSMVAAESLRTRGGAEETLGEETGEVARAWGPEE